MPSATSSLGFYAAPTNQQVFFSARVFDVVVFHVIAATYRSDSDPDCWLAHAKTMRNHSAHITGVPRAFHLGGESDGKVHLRNPKTGQSVSVHVPDLLGEWIGLMLDLLERLRASAIKANNVQQQEGVKLECTRGITVLFGRI